VSTNIFPLAYTLKLPQPPPQPPPVVRPLPPPDYVVNRVVNVPQPPPTFSLPNLPVFSPPKLGLPQPPQFEPPKLDLPRLNLPKLPGFDFAAFDPAKLPGFNEIMDWAKNRNVDVYRFDGGVTVLVDTDTKQGYMISPRGVKKLKDAEHTVKLLTSAANAQNWPELVEIKSYKDWIESLPPGVREAYTAAVGAGQFAAIAPAMDVVARWLQGKDPTADIEKFKLVSTAASQASPWAYLAGTGVGLGGAAGLGLSYLAERGAALGAQGFSQEVLTGLRASAKPAAIGVGLGGLFGSIEGELTGRNPLSEGAKYATAGLMLGLGGITREQALAGLGLGGLVGGTTAKDYGLGKGLEAGSTAFFLPLATYPTFALDVRPELAEPAAADARYASLIRYIASQVRADMSRPPHPGLAPDEVVNMARGLRWQPDAQLDLFSAIAEDALSKIRGGGDSDVVLAQLSLIRQKLDPVSRSRFDKVLSQYGLLDVKHTEPDYTLTEEAAKGLSLFTKYKEPEYILTDEAAAGLNRFFKIRSEPEYSLTDEAAKQLAQFLKPRNEQQYALTDEAAAQLALFFREPERTDAAADNAILRTKLLQRLRTLQKGSEDAAGGVVVPKVIDMTPPKTDGAPKVEVITPPKTDGTVTPTTTPSTTPTTTVPVQQIVITPRNLASYLSNINIPIQLLFAPVAVAMPVLQQYLSYRFGAPVQLRLPPPPNPSMPLGAYLRSILPRSPALLGREREVYVLI